MANWKNESDRENGDGHDETAESVIKARQWIRGVADRSQDQNVRSLMSDLRSLEQMGQQYFLGLDYLTDERDDVDEVGPF